jgi:hypothetical protein
MASPRRCAAALAALLLAVAPLAPAAADSTSVYEVLTTAIGVSVSSTQHPAASIVTGGLVDSSAGYSSSAISSAGASATAAAAVYPGDLVASGPALLCSQFLPCPVDPPSYPLLAQASWPERPDASAGSATPVGTAHASAGANRTEGVTEVVGASAPGTPILISVGSQSTRTRAWADDAGAHVRASSTLQDVVVGPLHIAVVAATDDVDVAPSGRVTDRPRIQLSGVTFAGLTASVDGDGVHVLGVSQSLPARTLSEQGVDVRAIGTTKTDATGAARSTAGGLQVTFSVPVQGVPPVVPGLPGANRTYLGQATIGGVGAAVAVGASDGPLLSVLPAPAPGSLAERLMPARRLGGTTGATSESAATTIPGAAPVAVATPPRRSTLPQPDLRLLALLLGVVPTSLLVGWRLAARWRVP